MLSAMVASDGASPLSVLAAWISVAVVAAIQARTAMRTVVSSKLENCRVGVQCLVGCVVGFRVADDPFQGRGHGEDDERRPEGDDRGEPQHGVVGEGGVVIEIGRAHV